ncbi:MAG: tetratricopeptide repeat protein, partial [Planctomycetota bacterium]
EMRRIILEEEPRRPSVLVSTLKAEQLSTVCDRRKIDAGRLSPSLQGELDWIVMKALEKDPDRRYGTPDELAADIERFLEGEAVAACPPSPVYRLRKFARRNRTGLAISGLMMAVLLLGVGGIAYHLFQVSKARSNADVAALESFVEDLLGIDDSRTADGYSPDPNVTLLILLKNAEARVDDRLMNRPDIKAKMKGILARSFNSLGQYDDAIRLYRNYRDFLSASNGLGHPETIGVMERMVRLHIANTQLSQAEELAEDALRYSRTYLGDEHELTLQLLHDRATLYFEQGMGDEAVKVYREVLEVRRRLIGDSHGETLDTMSQLALVLDSLERYDEARELYVSVVESCRAALSVNDARLASALQQLGRCYLLLGRRNEWVPGFDEASALLVESLAIYDRNRGPDHTDTLESQFLLAQVYAEQRQLGKTQPLLEDLVNRLDRLRGPSHRTTLEATNLLGWTYLHRSELTEAEYVLTGAFEQLRQNYPDDPLRIQVMGNLAIARFQMGKLAGSVAIDEQILMLAPQVLGPDHMETAAARARLGFAYLDLGRIADAKRNLEKAYQSCRQLPGSASLLEAIERCETQFNGLE